MDTNFRGKGASEHLLCGVYKNVKMASESIVSVLPKVEDKFLIGELTAHLEGYSSMAHDIENMMHERGIEPTPPGMLTKIGAAAGVALNTMINKTPSRIARIYMGEMRDAARRLEHTCDEVSHRCDARVVGICREVIEKERQNSEKMEAFI